VRNLFEAVSEADTPDNLVRALDQAVAHMGFPFVQVLLAAPLPVPTALVMRHQSEKLIQFDRAVIAASELSSPYDYDLGDPARDPVLDRIRRAPLPVMTDRDSYVEAGLADVGDWILEHDRGQAFSIQLPLLVPEFSNPLAVSLCMQRRERISERERLRLEADVALLGVHAVVGSNRALKPLLVSAKRAGSPLTPAMRQYLIWAERGKTASETADIVGRSYSTIKNVLGQALERMGCSSKADAIRLARANGWL
jgi:DNA-binding CsgD family transcriptional regulator